MIVVIRQGQNEKQINNLRNWIKSLGLEIHESRGENSLILGLIGDTSKVDIDLSAL